MYHLVRSDMGINMRKKRVNNAVKDSIKSIEFEIMNQLKEKLINLRKDEEANLLDMSLPDNF